MTRPLLLPLGLLLAGLAGCAAPAPRQAVPATPAPRVAGPATYQSPAPNPAMRDRAAVAASCRDQADRTLVQRDRGQILREDERDSRLGSDATAFSLRSQTDRLGRQFERDRIAEECVRMNLEAPPSRPAATR
jgi:hypothetical protein